MQLILKVCTLRTVVDHDMQTSLPSNFACDLSASCCTSVASVASSADGTFRDWISDSRSEFPSSPPSIASAVSGLQDTGSPALPAVVTRPQVNPTICRV